MPSHNESKYTPSVWGTRSLRDFKTPSGQLCQIRLVSVETLAADGYLDQLDLLTNKVATDVVAPAQGRRPQDHQKKQPTKAEIAAAQSNPKIFGLFDKVADIVPMMAMVNKVVAYIVVQPEIRIAFHEDGSPLAHDDREEGVVYADTISMEDRFAIFQTSIGEMGELSTFRKKSKKTVGDVEDGGGVPPDPE